MISIQDDDSSPSRNRKLETFSKILEFRTISPQPGAPFNSEPFRKLADYLTRAFPLVHEAFEREEVGDGSLLFTLAGSDPELNPILLTAHLDVVPADEDSWSIKPFSGTIRNGRIISRGAVDYKVGVAGQLQACEDLLSDGFRPRRTVMLAFGHDEEIGGAEGAASMVEILSRRGIRLSSVLDEGGYIYSLPWLSRDVAIVGLAEKGYLTLRFSASGHQGHASAPSTSTAAGRLCSALSSLETSQFPVRLCEPVEEMFRSTMSISEQSGKEDACLDEIVMEAVKWPIGNAFSRTTTALTMLSGSQKENIIPGNPWALVNFRSVPGDSSRKILDHARGIAGEYDVEVDYEDPRHVYEPSEVSSADSEEFKAIGRIVSEIWPGTPVLPGIFPAATDSRHYGRIADNVFRFVPIHLGERGLGSLHSRDEFITVDDYLNSVKFYLLYIMILAGEDA